MFNYKKILINYDQNEVNELMKFFLDPQNMILLVGGSYYEWPTKSLNEYNSSTIITRLL